MVAFQDHAPGPDAALDLLWLHGLCPWVPWPCREERRRGQMEECWEMAVASALAVWTLLGSLLDFRGCGVTGLGRSPSILPLSSWWLPGPLCCGGASASQWMPG